MFDYQLIFIVYEYSYIIPSDFFYADHIMYSKTMTLLLHQYIQAEVRTHSKKDQILYYKGYRHDSLHHYEVLYEQIHMLLPSSLSSSGSVLSLPASLEDISYTYVSDSPYASFTVQISFEVVTQ